MARLSYNLDGAVFGVESTYGTAASTFTEDIGFFVDGTVIINDEVRQVRSIKGGADGILADRNVDLMHRVTGSITVQPTTLEQVRRAFSDYSATTTYTINPSRTVESLTMKGNYDGTDALQVVGLVLTNPRFSLTTDDILQITYDFIAKKESQITETITETPPSTDPLTFLQGSLTVDSNGYKINTFELNCNFNTEGRRNIESVSAGDERVITEVIKKNFEVTYSMNVDLEDATTEYQVYTGGSSPQSQRSDSTIVLTFTGSDTKEHTITITGTRGTQFEKGYRTDGEVKNFDTSGVAIDVAITGDV